MAELTPRPDGIVLAHFEGHIASWNAGAQQANGYTAKELIGKHFSVCYPPEEIAVGRKYSIRRSSGASILRWRRSRADGEGVAMMKTAEDRNSDDASLARRRGRRKVPCTVGGLHPKATMRSAVIRRSSTRGARTRRGVRPER